MPGIIEATNADDKSYDPPVPALAGGSWQPAPGTGETIPSPPLGGEGWDEGVSSRIRPSPRPSPQRGEGNSQNPSYMITIKPKLYRRHNRPEACLCYGIRPWFMEKAFFDRGLEEPWVAGPVTGEKDLLAVQNSRGLD